MTMFKVLILAAQNNVSDERMEFFDPGPAELASLPGFWAWRSHAGREHDPTFSGAAYPLWHDREAVRGVDRQLKASGYRSWLGYTGG